MTLAKLALAGSLAGPLAALMAGCTTAPAAPDTPVDRAPGAGGMCRAESSQELVGQRATTALGTEISRRTGARIFQWVPPETAVTMDYREDRVRVSYDRAMAITTIACG